VIVGPREALRTRRMRLRDVNWLGDASFDTAADARLEAFVRVRSTRPPQPAWLQWRHGTIEVELVDGEDGVSPGQACVFYDSADNEAQVLGGGFIAGTVSAARVAADRHDAVASHARAALS
jgi:tRNA-specific 2-thiouridylase